MAKAKPAAKKKAAPKKAAKKAAPKKAVKKAVKKVVKKAAPKKAAKKVVKKVAKKAAPKKKATKKAAPKKAAKKVVTKAAAAKPAVKKPAAPKGQYTKGDIVDHLAYSCGVTKKTATEMLNELVGLVSKNAKKGFTIPGLGKFSTQKYKKRNGRNPSTGQAMVIPAKTKVRFKVGKQLQDSVFPPKK